jgi:hypothetical protein
MSSPGPGFLRSPQFAFHWANALDFNVKGDGVVDDSVALLLLFDVILGQLSGGVVVLPPTPQGYVFSQTVNVPAGITVLVSNGVKFPSAKLVAAGGAIWDLSRTLANANAGSFLRAFGPDASSTIPANAWTAIVLDPAGEPWRQFGETCWEWIAPGDPDYALSPAGIRCLKEGVYDFTGSVVFDPATGTGTRGVRVIEVKGPYAGQWELATSIPQPKTTLAPVLVSGEAYQYAGNIVELQAWSDTATTTYSNPQSEWLSATLIGVGPLT